MSLGVTSDLNALAVLKEYYGVQDLAVILLRNSPVLAAIKKVRVGGKYVPLPMAIGGSGAIGSDFNQVVGLAGLSGQNVSMQVTPGRLFGAFTLSQSEYLSSEGDRAAFVSLLALKAMVMMDSIKKVLAKCLYGAGYLEQGKILAVDATNYLYIDVDGSTAFALEPGMQILFAQTTPDGTLRSATPVSIQKRDVVTSGATTRWRITFTSAYAASVAVTDWVLIKSGRDASGNPNAPLGLDAWLPTIANRAGATWDSYIATNFYGVDRSINVPALAGQYVLRNSGGNEKYTDAIIRLIVNCRNAGATPDFIVLNPDDLNTVLNEALANRTFFQNFGAVSSKESNKVTQGLSQINMSFSTSWINMIYDDPALGKGKGYVLSTDTIKMFTLTNAEQMTKATAPGNEPGGPKLSDGQTPTTNYQWLVDDNYTTTPVDLYDGPGIRVAYSFIGNFALTHPGYNGVVEF